MSLIHVMNEWKHELGQKLDADVVVESGGRKTPTGSLFVFKEGFKLVRSF